MFEKNYTINSKNVRHVSQNSKKVLKSNLVVDQKSKITLNPFPTKGMRRNCNMGDHQSKITLNPSTVKDMRKNRNISDQESKIKVNLSRIKTMRRNSNIRKEYNANHKDDLFQ